MKVLIITRRLPMLAGTHDVVSAVYSIPSYVEPDALDSWVEEYVTSHEANVCKEFPEFKSADFKGQIHKVIGSYAP